MGTRIISALVLIGIVLPILIIGGIPFQLLIYCFSMLALKEFMGLRSGKRELPLLIQFLAYLTMTFFIFLNVNQKEFLYMMDYRLLSGLFVSLLFPLILYHDQKVYNVEDAFFLIGGIFFLGTSFHLIIVLREINIHYLLYLEFIAAFTDMYALFTGLLIGKTKLLESVSPKKTVEGLIGGVVIGTLVPSYYYLLVINPTISVFLLLGMTLFLSLAGQFGDLIFSSMKRYYGKKDFSNLIPGHGGVLDRLDSLIFIVLCFTFFLNLI